MKVELRAVCDTMRISRVCGKDELLMLFGKSEKADCVFFPEQTDSSLPLLLWIDCNLAVALRGHYGMYVLWMAGCVLI